MSYRYGHEVLEVRSEALRGNPLGDPHVRELHVLVPEVEGTHPVIWVLGGYSGTPGSLLADDPWSEGLLRRVNRLASDGKLQPAIFVLPDCFTSLGGSQYLDSSAVGPYEPYLWEECRAAVEARWSCGKHGVAGKSSGGYGAIVNALRHPDLVRAVACHAGDMAFEYCYLGHFPALANALRRHGGVEAFFEAFRAATKKRSGEWFDPIQTLCMAACYSPDPRAPLGIGLPFDPETLALVPEVWERWLALDPVRMVDDPRHTETLKRLDLLFIDAGTRDEYHLQWGARRLAAKLRASGVAHEHEEFEDSHSSTSYRYDVSLPKLSAALRR